MRWGELTELRIGDLDVPTRVLTISRAVVQADPKFHPDGGRFFVKPYPKDRIVDPCSKAAFADWWATTAMGGFWCGGWVGGCAVDAGKPASDAAGGEPVDVEGGFPGAAEVFGQAAGQAQLGVGADDQPGPAVGLFAGAYAGAGPAQGLLERSGRCVRGRSGAGTCEVVRRHQRWTQRLNQLRHDPAADPHRPSHYRIELATYPETVLLTGLLASGPWRTVSLLHAETERRLTQR